MSVKDGKDYLYLIWKSNNGGRQYIIGQLTKNGQYEFQYCNEYEEAIKDGFKPLVSFENPKKIYTCTDLFPVFSSRLPDRKRKDMDKILFNIPKELKKQFQIAIIRNNTDTDMTQVLLDFIKEYIKKNNG